MRETIIPGLGSDVPELRKARALWQLNRFDESLRSFDEAVARYPQNLVALVDASRAFGARFEIGRAEQLLDRLTTLAGTRPDILHLVGQSYRMIFRPEKAIECFERVLQSTSDIPDAFLELALLYERRNRLESAFALIERCLRTAPDYLEAILFKAGLLRRLKQEKEADRLLQELKQNGAAHPLVRAQAWAELAQQHDRAGDYERAMHSMVQGKRILLQLEGPVLHESNVVLQHLGRLTDSLTSHDFQRWTAQSRTFAPVNSAVLASFPRSGTTLLEQVLDAHSGVVSSDEREAFARDIFPAMWLTPERPAPTVEALDQIPLDRLARLRHRYFEYMSAALNQPIGERIHLDKNPPLTLVLPGFLRLFPETKVLIALRDPRDVVVSCFMQYLPLNPNSVCFLTLERTARRYAHDMAAWRKLREVIASPWLEVRYEDAVANLEREARRAVTFLGLPWETQVLNYRDRLATKVVGSPTYQAVQQPLYTRAIGRWRNYEKFLQPCLPLLEESVQAFGY